MVVKIYFVTGNSAKTDYLSRQLGIEIEHKKLDIDEIQSLNLEEIVIDKAKKAFELVKKPVIVEDASLTIEGMGGLPGPLVKWFFESIGNEGICRFTDVSATRNAVTEVVFGYCDNDGVKTFTGSKAGLISREPRGKDGFGWDAVFIPHGYNKTRAEMTQSEMDLSTMRKEAIEKLADYLHAI
jgi:non-canonical purine NTP pyrophosphatase (RdgB/HAM1 family)